MKSLIVASALALAVASAARADGNLIVNGNFDTDLSSWTNGNHVASVFNQLDSAGSPSSGSAEVTSTQVDASSTSAGSGIYQCVSVTPGNYLVTALYFIPDGQDHTAAPDIGVAWFVDTQCQDIGSGPQQSLLDQGPSTTDTWLQLRGIVTAPSNAQSANVILRPRKVEAGGQVNVLFDAVFVPEPGSVALGVTAIAALAVVRRRSDL
jgi:hypothetical protein